MGWPPALTKREVEALLAAVAEHDGAPEAGGDEVAAEVVALVAALHAPLTRVVGAPADLSWPALVERAVVVGRWDPARAEAVRAAVPDAAARAALWDLVAELNELRGLERPA